MLPTFMYGMEFGGGGDLKNCHWKVFEKGMKMHMRYDVKVHCSTIYHIVLTEFEELPRELYILKHTKDFQHWLATYHLG